MRKDEGREFGSMEKRSRNPGVVPARKGYRLGAEIRIVGQAPRVVLWLRVDCPLGTNPADNADENGDAADAPLC
jgi:hypothetical protein